MLGEHMNKQLRVDGETTHVPQSLSGKRLHVIVTVLLSAAIVGLTTSNVSAETPTASTEKSETLEAIVVTGSRISRRDYQSTVPS
jgi:hypothetical protein